MGITIDQVHIDRVLTALQRQGAWHSVETVAGLCPDLTWDQVARVIVYLTRSGQVCLTLDASRTYWVKA